jgi:hypothetical protein
MAWTSVRTWVAGEIVTAAIMNTHVRDNLAYLKGVGQVPTIQSGLVIDNSLGSEYLKLPLLSTAECTTVLAAEGQVAHDEATHRIKLHDGTAVRSLVSTADVDDTPVDSATTDPISSNWAYDHLNVLTAQGSIPYATAARTWVELAKSTAGKILSMNAGATAPEWRAETARTNKLKAETRAKDAGTGSVSYTGYGFQPSALIILSDGVNSVSVGFGDVNNDEYSVCIKNPIALTSGATIIYYEESAGKTQTATLTTLDADGFTLSWTRTGATAAGTINFYVLASR